MMWNEEMAGAQKKYPGRRLGERRGAAAGYARSAIEVLDDAVNRLGLMGVNLPGSVGEDARIDAERLRAVLRRVAKSLACRCSCIRPTRSSRTCSDGYDGALHLSLGRVIEVSVAAMRLILSGHDGASSEPEDRDVAHRRRAALSGRPHGQELQGGEAAEAGAATT